MRKHALKRAKIKLHDVRQQIRNLFYPNYPDPTPRVDGFDYWLQDDEPLCDAAQDFFFDYINDLIDQCIKLTEKKEKEERVTDNDTENRSERPLKSSIDDLISENTSLWNFLGEIEHSEKLLKSRIDYLTFENMKSKNMIDEEKSQNEKLANDLRYFRDLAYENSGDLKDLHEENEELKSKAATAENEELKVKAITAMLEREELKVKATTAMLEEKCEYIELLENQKSELGHTLDQTKHNLALVLKGNEKLATDLRILGSTNESLWNDFKNSQAKLDKSCAKNEALSALNTEKCE